MNKVDYPTNKWVADYFEANYDWVTSATASEIEDYSVKDVSITTDDDREYPVEVKRINGGYKMKEDGEFRDYFTRELYEKLRFESGTTSGTPVSGTPVYFVNAEDKFGNMENGKWKKLLNAKACLVFIAPDGMLLFSPKTLKEAFVGYADYLVKHTTEFGKKGSRHWEKKAVLNLEKGRYIPCNPPAELFTSKQ